MLSRAGSTLKRLVQTGGREMGREPGMFVLLVFASTRILTSLYFYSLLEPAWRLKHSNCKKVRL